MRKRWRIKILSKNSYKSYNPCIVKNCKIRFLFVIITAQEFRIPSTKKFPMDFFLDIFSQEFLKAKELGLIVIINVIVNYNPLSINVQCIITQIIYTINIHTVEISRRKSCG